MNAQANRVLGHIARSVAWECARRDTAACAEREKAIREDKRLRRRAWLAFLGFAALCIGAAVVVAIAGGGA